MNTLNMNSMPTKFISDGWLRKCTLILALLLMGNIPLIFAQTTTVTLGVVATPNASASTVFYTGTTATFGSSRGAYIYTNTEINNAGFVLNGQKINKLRFQISGATAGFIFTGATLKVYLRPTTLTVPSTSWNITTPVAANLVYSATTITIPAASAGTWYEIDIAAANYIWDNTRNLEVMTEWVYLSASRPATQITWTCVSGTFAAWQTSNTTTPPATLSANQNRPYLQLDFINAGVCINPVTPGISTATAGTSSSAPICTGGATTLALSGHTFGDNQTYKWQSGPTSSGPWTDVNTPQNNFPLTVNPTSTTFPYSSVFYQCEISCSGGAVAYSTPVEVFVRPWLNGGTYTIDASQPTSGSNFQTFTAAAAALSCGINGPIVFNVLPLNGTGVYNEQVEFLAPQNNNATNTITINGNGNKITFAATLAAAPWTFMLSGTDYVSVNNLVIEGTNTAIALPCHLWNGADNNTFTNCTISGAFNSITTSVVVFSISGSQNSGTSAGLTGVGSGNNNVLDGCTIRNGGVGVNFVGTTVVSGGLGGPLGTGGNRFNTIRNCSILDFYSNGISCTNSVGPIISNNLLERLTRTVYSTTYAGIIFNGGVIAGLIERNRIRNPFALSPSQNSATASCISIQTTTPEI